jgi:hypothetical protein
MMVLPNGKKKADIQIDEHALGKEIPRLENFQVVQDLSEKPNPGSVEARYHTHSHLLAHSILPNDCGLLFFIGTMPSLNSIIHYKTARIEKMVRRNPKHQLMTRSRA